MAACRNSSICSNVQITKYWKVPNHYQIWSKPWFLWGFFPKFWITAASLDMAYLFKFWFYSKFVQNIQIFKDAPLIAIHFWSEWWADKSRVSNPVVHHILRKDWDMKYNCAIFFIPITPKYIYLIAKKGEFGMILITAQH